MSYVKTSVDGKTIEKNANMSDMKVGKVLYDVYQGIADEVPDNAIAFYKDVLTRRGELNLWAQLAYQIFQSNDQSYWDHAGKGWVRNFGKGGNYFDLVDFLCNRHPRNNGDDPCMSTGLVAVTSLKEVENEAGKVAEQLIGRKLKAHSFINACNIPFLHDDDKKQTILCTFAGNRDRYGKTFQFGYNVFGLAFYNFRVRIISPADVEYSTVLNGRTVAEAIEQNYSCPGFASNVKSNADANTYPLTNEGREEGSFSTKLTTSNSATASNTISNSKQYTFGQEIGITYGQEMELTNIGKVMFSSTLALSFQQVLATAYEEAKSVTKSTSSESNITVTLPPHTALLVLQSGYNGNTELKYSCPVMVEFDVAVLSMCGTCYDDNAAVQTFSTAGYKQRSFCTLFDGTCGSDASENLYVRFNNDGSVANYDKTNGKTKVMQKNKVIGEEIDWARIKKQAAATSAADLSGKSYEKDGKKAVNLGLMNPANLVDVLTEYRPASSMGAMMAETMNSISYQVKEPVPLYPLSRLKLKGVSDTIDLKPGDILYPESWEIEGYDTEGVPFYGFNVAKGAWKIFDESGNESSEIVCSEIRKLTHENIFKAIGEGEAYAVYKIDDEAYACKNGKIDPEKVKSVSIRLRVRKDVSVDKIEIQAKNEVQILDDEVADLNNLTGVTVIASKEGEPIYVPVTWKVTDGAAFIVGNKIELSSEQCKVVATYGKVQSNELELRKNENCC